MKRVIAVVGAAECDEGEAVLAEEVGRRLAERGAVIVCGGRGGVMQAACRGAQQAGGLTIGILPGVEAASGNPHLTVALPTGLGEARNAVVAQAGEALIAIGGGHGTLSEIALAIKAGRKAVALRSWSGRDAVGEPLGTLVAEGAEQAVQMALGEAG